MSRLSNVIQVINSKCHVLGVYQGLYTWAIEKIAIFLQNQKLENKKHEIVEAYLVRNYLNRIIFSNHHKDIGVSNEKIEKIPVWIFWFQGEQNMPPLVKSCFRNINRLQNNGITQVYLLTKDNISNYVTLPDYVYQKVESKEITLTHFSDILRFALLYNYGGAWVDSTVWLNEPIKSEYFQYRYWSIRLKQPKFTISITKYQWSGFFFLINQKHDDLAKFVINFLLEYWIKESHLIDYLLIDYIIDIAQKKIKYVEYEFLNIPYTNEKLYKLYQCINKEYNENIFKGLLKNTQIFKLSYKGKFKKYTKDKKKHFIRLF